MRRLFLTWLCAELIDEASSRNHNFLYFYALYNRMVSKVFLYVLMHGY